jgi:hypothetical protein
MPDFRTTIALLVLVIVAAIVLAIAIDLIFGRKP